MPDNKDKKSTPHPSVEELMARTLDLIIIGGGPAGMSAAVYASRRKIDTLVITDDVGGQTAWSAEIENYLGFDMISGFELSQKFFEHVKKIDDDNAVYDLELIKSDPVVKVEKDGNMFSVTTQSGKLFTSQSVLIATGAKPRMLGIPGEKDLIGKGVTFCATCDGPLYNNKTIAVIGGGNSAMEAVLYLHKIAKQIYLVNINKELSGEISMADEINKLKNVEVLPATETLEFSGKNKIEKMKVRGKDSGEEKWIEIEGVFEEIGYIPNSDLFADLVKTNKHKEIIIDEMNRTSMPGVYAAGDVSSIPVKQIIVAAGEGAKASLAIYDYLLPKNHD